MSETIQTADKAKVETDHQEEIRWFALRDLKRANAKQPAYKQLKELGIEVFTPMATKNVLVKGQRKRITVPVLGDLLFAHSARTTLDPVIETIPTLQYRYARGAYCQPVVIRDREMETFILATSHSISQRYLTPEEVNKLKVGSDVEITEGPMAGLTAKIVKVRGARNKRVLVSLPGLIAAIVEISPSELKILD